MSSKPAKKESEPKAPAVKAQKAAPKRPSGKAPDPMVQARHGTGFVTRPGKGFSHGELSGAGLSYGLASRWGLPVDVRRRSVLGGNTSSLRRWGAHSGLEPRPESRTKRAEKELEKVEKGVKKEAVKAKEGVVKAEKVVKRGAVKAERAVRAKPKPKVKKKKAEK